SQLAPSMDLFQHPRPQGQGVDIGAVEAGQAVAQVQFGWANYVGYQDSGLAVLDVERSGDTSIAQTIHYATTDGSASAGVDYLPAAGTLTFQPGQTVQTILVQLINPTKLQPIKTLTVTLSDPSNSVRLGNQSSTTLSLVSNQTLTPGTLRFGQSA